MSDVYSVVFSLVEVFKKLPLIGEKTAIRISIKLMNDKKLTHELIDRLRQVLEMVQKCRLCNMPTASDLCEICSSPERDKSIIAIVSDPIIPVLIEKTRVFKGRYLLIDALPLIINNMEVLEEISEKIKKRIREEKIREIVVLMNPLPETDAFIYFLKKRLKSENVRITAIARGVAYGSDLSFYDSSVIAKSFMERIPVEQIFKG